MHNVQQGAGVTRDVITVKGDICDLNPLKIKQCNSSASDLGVMGDRSDEARMGYRILDSTIILEDAVLNADLLSCEHPNYSPTSNY